MRKSKNHDNAIKNAYNMLVTFRKIVEEKPSLKTYSPAEIEEVYKNLWCETLNEKAPWS